MLFRIDLRRLIVSLCVLSVLLTLGASFYASYRVQRDILLAGTLESNQAYARKLAIGTEIVLDGMRRQLAYSAGRFDTAERLDDVGRQEADRLLRQGDHFNSVLVVDRHGTVAATAPADLGLTGAVLATPGAQEALAARRPLTSHPFVGATERWIITLTHPIHGVDGRYLGYVAGALYLHEPNALHELLGPELQHGGSYMYAVDARGTLIYHPNRSRVGEDLSGNAFVRATMRGETGAMRGVNRDGVDMLAGYSIVPGTGWGIVAQRPVELALHAISSLFWRTVLNTIPLLLLSLFCIWWFARRISLPLSQLAQAAVVMDRQDAIQRMRGIGAWYVEAAQLKRALLSAAGKIRDRIARLRRESSTDVLTGLLNRRGMAAAIQALRADGAPVAVVVLDVDRFKAVNDTHGHAVGDAVLRAVASCMRAGSRAGDILVRSGGEEFLVLLPGVDLEQAGQAAERLRRIVAEAVIEPGGPVTVSLGVAHAHGPGMDVGAAAQRADRALYAAKQGGRNCVWLAEADGSTRPVAGD